MRPELAAQTAHSTRQVHVRYVCGDEVFLFQHVLSQDLAVPQQWSTRFVHADGGAGAPGAAPAAIVLCLRLGDFHNPRGLHFLPESGENLSFSTATGLVVAEERAGEEGKALDAEGGGAQGEGRDRALPPMMFVRDEEGDATMGQAVLLRNRLFYELL